jgi:23S rRNA (cytosine1962-C5)-methyltransferase
MPRYPIARLRPERRKSVLNGHPWIFSGALLERPQAADGGLVTLACGDEVLGTGYYNSNTDISVRLLSRRDEVVDAGFFARRFARLRDERARFIGSDTTAWRAVFGEADGCPGLVVDRYADNLVMQLHTAGMNALRNEILEALIEVHEPTAVIERSDLAVRRQEGLPDQPVGVLHGQTDGAVEFREHGHVFFADMLKGQKTGFFLDQRENRLSVKRWARGRSLLNVFCYTGGFSVYAAAGGARRVASLDASAPAIATCRRNLEANGFQYADSEYRVEDAFDALASLKDGEFDCILLDPPSMAKNRNQLKNAIKAYTALNTRALKALPEGGLLISASCTSHIDPLTFQKILHESGVRAGCNLKMLEWRGQPADHPYLFSFPEGGYLKFVVAEKTGL